MNYNHCPENQIFSNSIHDLEYLNPQPIFICPTGKTQNEGHPPTFSILNFGFSLDHDSSDMHSISNASCRTFSFIESVSMVPDAFARCIGGFLSIMAQELQLIIRLASPGVQIGMIPFERYANVFFEGGSKGMIC